MKLIGVQRFMHKKIIEILSKPNLAKLKSHNYMIKAQFKKIK